MIIPPVKMNLEGFKALDELHKVLGGQNRVIKFTDSLIAIAIMRQKKVALGYQFNYQTKRKQKILGDTQSLRPRDFSARTAGVYSDMVNNNNIHINTMTLKGFYDDFVVPYAENNLKDVKGFMQRHKPLIETYGGEKLAGFKKYLISQLLTELANRVSPPTCARYLAAWSKFFNLAVSYDFIESNPCKGIPRPRENPPRDRVLSPSEVTALVDAALSDINSVHACSLLFCLFSGLRQGNVISLRLSWFNENYSMLSIPDSKSGKPIYMALNSALQSLIKQLLPYSDGTYLFPSSLSTPSNPKPMGKPTKCLARLVERVQAKTGITEHFHCHDLRRTHASQMLRVSGDIRLCQQALGHADIKTTQRYAYHSNPELLAASEQTVTALLGGCELELFNPATEK
jgi:integrase